MKKLLKVQKYLGSGASKICYTLPGGKKVALLTDKYQIRSELQMLRKLQKARVPVLKLVKAKVLNESNEPVDALVAPRYEYHTFNFTGKRLTRDMKACLRKIRNALARAKLDCTDLQFLAKPGKVVLCDPGYIYTLRSRQVENPSVQTIDRILDR